MIQVQQQGLWSEPAGLSTRLTTPLRLPQHAHQDRPQRPVLLAVDQELGEGAGLRVAPELADPVGSLEVRKHEDVEKFAAGNGATYLDLRGAPPKKSTC